VEKRIEEVGLIDWTTSENIFITYTFGNTTGLGFRLYVGPEFFVIRAGSSSFDKFSRIL
jgi:hypothetical protein